MINYSITMCSANQNLFEINQAKSRIKAAVAAGKTPAAEDEALVKTEVKKAFARAQMSEVISIDKFSRHISSHGCVYSRADIAAILYMAVDCMRELLLEGKKIRLGDLGDFSVQLISTGAATMAEFTAQNITGVKVVWDCGSVFKDLLADAEFNLVASRSAQGAVLKAIRTGKTMVDLNATGIEEDKTEEPAETSSSDNTNSSGGATTPTPEGGENSGGGEEDHE